MTTGTRPPWLRVTAPGGEVFQEVDRAVAGLDLHTVCQSAACPNQGECWGRGTATFMILGNVCTRSCGFCAVKTGRPEELDLDEPRRVAEAVRRMDLEYAVITSVNRDELVDGGAAIFADTIDRIRSSRPGCRVEVLIPDFQGDPAALQTILDAGPDVLNHNTETVPRLYSLVRPQARYTRTLDLLRRASRAGAWTKSGIMLGLGEVRQEVLSTLQDIAATGCRIITIGQYLRPSTRHIPIDRYVRPEEFQDYRRAALAMGFDHCESGPLVRSSYRAESHPPPLPAASAR